MNIYEKIALAIAVIGFGMIICNFGWMIFAATRDTDDREKNTYKDHKITPMLFGMIYMWATIGAMSIGVGIVVLIEFLNS